MRTARRFDHGQRRRQAAPPAAQASSPGGAEDTHQPRHHAQQADPHTLDSGPTTTTYHRHPGTASAATINSSTEAPTPGHDPQPRQQDRPTARHSPTEPGQRTPRPDARRHHPRRQDAHRTRHAPPYYYITHHRRQPARTPDSGPRWTGGPAADSNRHRPRPAHDPGHSPRIEQKPDATKPTAEIKKKFENTP